MIDDLKLLLGLYDVYNEEIERKLRLILNETTQRLKILLGGMDPPEEMNYIIVGVAVKRYNRIGSEGTTSHQIEGETRSFVEDDFAEYKEDIRTFLDNQQNAQKGRMMFI